LRYVGCEGSSRFRHRRYNTGFVCSPKSFEEVCCAAKLAPPAPCCTCKVGTSVFLSSPDLRRGAFLQELNKLLKG